MKKTPHRSMFQLALLASALTFTVAGSNGHSMQTTKIDAYATNFTFGTDGDDTIEAVYLKGDLILGLGGNDIINGDIGDDQLSGNLGNDTLHGNAGNDYVNGNEGNDTLFGDDGQDQLSGDFGDDHLYGGAGNDQLSDIDGTNILEGGDGDDSLYGGNGIDTLLGDGGNDVLFGEAGNDLLFGGAGDDKISTKMTWSAVGNDHVDGGDGIDTIDYSNLLYYANKAGTAWGGVTVNLGLTTAQKIGGGGTDTIINVENINGAAGDNTLTGSSGNNVISGNAGNDKLNGAGGNDTLVGGGGADTLNGGPGDDLLIGGAGSNDTLTGGTGADTFVVDILINRAHIVQFAGTDTVTDFNRSQGDHFKTGKAVNFIGSNSFSATHVAEVQVKTTGLTQVMNYDYNGDGVTDSTVNIIGAATLAGTDFIN